MKYLHAKIIDFFLKNLDIVDMKSEIGCEDL